VRRRRLLIGGAVGGGVLLLGIVAFFLLFGRIAAWAVKSRVIPRVSARLDRDVTVGEIDADRDRVVLKKVVVRGPADGPDTPLVFAPRIEVEYDFWAAVGGDFEIGTVTVTDPAVHMVRGGDGDNVSDVIDRVLGRKRAGEADGVPARRGLGLRPARVVVTGGSFIVRDGVTGATLSGAGVTTEAVRGEPVTLVVTELELETGFGASAGAERVDIDLDPDNARATATTEIHGGWVKPWRGFALTGIDGTVRRDARPGHARIDLAGGYGGVQGTLWTATGWIAPERRNGSLDLKADRFTFDRLRPILEGSMVEDFDKTSIDVTASLRLENGVGEFEGELDLQHLTLHHAKVAEQPVRDLSFAATVAGGFDLNERSISLTKGVVDYHGVVANVDAFAFLPGGLDPETGERRASPRVGGRLVIPNVTCQQMLDVMPPELTPHLQGFKLRGNFSTDIFVDVDWADLDATKLGGSLAIRRCKVLEAPRAVDAARFLASFEHTHPAVPDETESYIIGPENPDFVPITDVSINIINSIMTTEDSRFYKHWGFIPSEFRTALVKNLKAGKFKYGASSISMQTVKNVLLRRDKLLSRKLQELFLTWYLETELEKDRILEIYLNAIEYGPGIYGIGKATQAYFGKHPRDITPVEAAFFSSILPGPKPRYVQYCRNKLSRYTTNKIPRIMKKMFERERLDEQQLALYEAGLMTLQFYYPEGFDQRACLKRIEDYMPEEPEPEPEPSDSDEDSDDD
jgi:hypothetical protein